MARRALHLALDALLAVSGAHAVRVVDGRTGTVVATAGAVGYCSPLDAPAAVVGLAREAVASGADADVLVVSTSRSVHLLCPCAVFGAFVHVRLGRRDADVATARRALADAALHGAIHGLLAAPPSVPRNAVSPSVPRNAVSPTAMPGQQPALASLVPGRAAVGPGARATIALAAVTAPAPRNGPMAGKLLARPD